MFTHKDIENKSIFVINGQEHQNLRLKSGFLYLENTQTEKCITKFPFPKILFLIVVGHTNITTALIDKCNAYKVPLLVMKPNFRSVFYFGNFAEANYLLRKKQHNEPKCRLDIAQHIVQNKFENQIRLIKKSRKKDALNLQTILQIEKGIKDIPKCDDMRNLMTLEGRISKQYFKAYFNDLDWKGRKARVKFDVYNACLDIGYTFMFNFIENMCRLFGFDLYVGVYHQLWFRRKSLVCDLIEAFRCIIERKVRKAFINGSFDEEDFSYIKRAYYIKYGNHTKYTNAFYNEIIPYKSVVFKYIQTYYRAFMGNKTTDDYPVFHI